MKGLHRYPFLKLKRHINEQCQGYLTCVLVLLLHFVLEQVNIEMNSVLLKNSENIEILLEV